ncbi:MAG: hypothetical protein J07HX5_00524 [halophilic archaeon J07HX5]|nr:MAG: hypothetical protein J07HX5_00524 [halophilic archaeon J07HX5]
MGMTSGMRRYAPSPASANADLNVSENHEPIPAIVPNNGPSARSIYRYVPPACGIAVAISAFESAAGSTTNADSTYARITAGPAFLNPSAGSTKMPLPIIAPMLIIIVE